MSHKSTLAWDSTPNPAPVVGSTATWTVNTDSNAAIHWSSSDPSVISPEHSVTNHGQGTLSTNTLTVHKRGLVTITATQEGVGITQDVAAFEMFAYNPEGTMGTAPSNAWTVCRSQPEGLPSFHEMQ